MRFDRLAAAALILTLGGCGLFAASPWKAGDDPRGRSLQARGAQVVGALQRFRADAGHLPAHLFELVPKYLPALPDGLNADYEPDKNRLGFGYQPTWPAPGLVNCSTTIDAVAWDCYGYI